MSAWEIVRLVLFAASALGIVVVAWLWWREGRPVLTGRGEMSLVPGDDVDPDAGEAYCTDPPLTAADFAALRDPWADLVAQLPEYAARDRELAPFYLLGGER